jgi:hypothetical protein
MTSTYVVFSDDGKNIENVKQWHHLGVRQSYADDMKERKHHFIGEVVLL